MKTKTLSLSPAQIETLHHQLQAYPLRVLQHTHFQAKLDSGHITAYLSGKVVFSGDDALLYAQQFQQESSQDEAGSDEVGTGDYFGPVVVCAAYLSSKNRQDLKAYSIMDSKQITDDQILTLAPILMKKLVYSVLILDNSTYNRIHQNLNLNAIKARLHQKAYDHLRTKLNGSLPDLMVVDQFTPQTSYYNYLDEDYGLPPLHFETKAENKYLSVACASIIARYTFLKSLEQYSQKYDIHFPKGAGEAVDAFGVEFVRQHSFDELSKVAKIHFKNTIRIKEKVEL